MQNKLTIQEIKKVLLKYNNSRDNLINALHELQDKHPLNYISNQIMDECASYFNLTKAQVYGVVTYYSMFSTKPKNKYRIYLCKSPVCTNMGSEDILNYLNDKHKISLDNTDNELFSLERVECLGRCGKAPSMMINKEVYTELSPEKIDKILNDLKS